MAEAGTPWKGLKVDWRACEEVGGELSTVQSLWPRSRRRERWVFSSKAARPRLREPV